MAEPFLACVGTGVWGKNLVRNFHGVGALASVCDTDRQRWQALAADYPGVGFTTDLNEVLDDPAIRAVSVATPPATHGDIVARALGAGKDVFVEKPICLSASEARSLVDQADRGGQILMVGHLLWYHPAVQKLEELVRAGELGDIQYIYSNRVNLGRIRREENILWSFAPHDVSVILGLVGEWPSSIHAAGGDFVHDGVADVTVSTLGFPSGVKAHIFVSWLHPFKEQKLVVVGDRRMVVFDGTAQHERMLSVYAHSIDWEGDQAIVTRAEAEHVPVDGAEPLRAECQHFVDCVRTRAQPRTDGTEALRVLQVLEHCQYALENGGAVVTGMDPTLRAQMNTPQL